jgi:GH18 family chitinase
MMMELSGYVMIWSHNKLLRNFMPCSFTDAFTYQYLDTKADLEMPVDGAQGCIGAFMKLKQELHPHLRVLLSVGGASGSAPFASITADDSKLHAFCTSIRDMLQKHSFDGVDSKWRGHLFDTT